MPLISPLGLQAVCWEVVFPKSGLHRGWARGCQALPGGQDLGRQRLTEPAWPQQARTAGAGQLLGPQRIRHERVASDEMRAYATLLSWTLCQVKQVMLQGFFSEFTVLDLGKGGELSLSNL